MGAFTFTFAALALAPQGLSVPTADAARVAAWEQTLAESQELFAARAAMSPEDQQQVLSRVAQSLARATFFTTIHDSDDLMADGPGFQAYLGSDGVHFLGDAPGGPVAVELDLVSIGRTGFQRAIEGGVSPARAAGTDDVEYHHGGGLIERYTLLEAGLEQSFEFAQPLPGSGDLVVRLQVDSALAAPLVHESREGMRFSRDAENGIRLGAVTGIDAAGASAEGWMSFDGEYLELVLPGSFVDAASYPLVLDPLIGAEVGVYPASADTFLTRPDVAYDVTNDKYMVVWEEQNLLTGVSRLAIRWVSSSGVTSGGGAFSDGSAQIRNPAICNLNETDTYLVVCERDYINGNPNDLFMFEFDAAAQTAVTSFTVLSTPGDQRSPDVSGDPVLTYDDAFVVWDEPGLGIAGALVEVGGVGGGVPVVVGAPFSISSGTSDRSAAISKGMGNPGRALVVWTRSGNGDHTYGRLYNFQGTALSSEVALTTGAGVTNLSPDVDGDGDQFMAVYESGPGGARSIKCVRATWDGANLNVSAEDTVSDTGNLILPGIGYAGGAYIVAWTNFGGGATMQVKSVFPDCTTCEKTKTIDGAPGFGRYVVQVATTYSASLAGTSAFLTWERQDFSLPDNNASIRGHLFDAISAGPASQALRNSGIAPNPAGMVLPAGPPILGQLWLPSIDHTTFMPSAIFDALIVRLGPLDVPVGALGTLLVNVTTPGQTFITAAGQPLLIFLPLDCSLIGATLYGQGLSDNGLELKLTDAIDFTLGTF